MSINIYNDFDACNEFCIVYIYIYTSIYIVVHITIIYIYYI